MPISTYEQKKFKMYYGLMTEGIQYPCKKIHFQNMELRNIIKKCRIIKNLDISKTMINRANKSELYNIINKFNIDINKFDWYNKIVIREFNKFNSDIEFYNYGNNIHKPCQNRDLVYKLYKRKVENYNNLNYKDF